MTDQDHLDRINALTRNARSTWFALLAALVFVGITLMGVEHIDFYGVDRATTLPLVNVQIPTRFFFVSSPILIAAIYCYFHLYLIRLWDALGDAPARLKGVRLGDAVNPWLVTDAALFLRATACMDNSVTQRTFDRCACYLSLAFVFLFAPVVLAASSFFSIPARYSALPLNIGFFALTLGAGIMSWRTLRVKLCGPQNTTKVRSSFWTIAVVVVLGVLIVTLMSPKKVVGLSTIKLSGLEIVERPVGWLPYPYARNEFRSAFCVRLGVVDCKNLASNQRDAFRTEFERRRRRAIRDMARPSWDKQWPATGQIDFWRANFTNSFLAGANLREAHLSHVSFKNAYMEAVNLNHAQITNVDLSGAELHLAQLVGAKLTNVTVRGAKMEGAVLNYSYLSGGKDDKIDFGKANLHHIKNFGGALRHVDLTKVKKRFQADFRNTFLDGSIEMTAGFREQMGNPCQWVKEIIDDDATFFGRWRGWIEMKPDPTEYETWDYIAPKEFENVTAIKPDDPTCKWKTGPMPGAAQ